MRKIILILVGLFTSSPPATGWEYYGAHLKLDGNHTDVDSVHVTMNFSFTDEFSMTLLWNASSTFPAGPHDRLVKQWWGLDPTYWSTSTSIASDLELLYAEDPFANPPVNLLWVTVFFVGDSTYALTQQSMFDGQGLFAQHQAIFDSLGKVNTDFDTASSVRDASTDADIATLQTDLDAVALVTSSIEDSTKLLTRFWFRNIVPRFGLTDSTSFGADLLIAKSILRSSYPEQALYPLTPVDYGPEGFYVEGGDSTLADALASMHLDEIPSGAWGITGPTQPPWKVGGIEGEDWVTYFENSVASPADTNSLNIRTEIANRAAIGDTINVSVVSVVANRSAIGDTINLNIIDVVTDIVAARSAIGDSNQVIIVDAVENAVSNRSAIGDTSQLNLREEIAAAVDTGVGGTYPILVTVTDSVSTQLINKADVSIFSDDLSIIYANGQTGTDGEFRGFVVGSGDYIVSAAAFNYLSKDDTVTVVTQDEVDAPLALAPASYPFSAPGGDLCTMLYKSFNFYGETIDSMEVWYRHQGPNARYMGGFLGNAWVSVGLTDVNGTVAFEILKSEAIEADGSDSFRTAYQVKVEDRSTTHAFEPSSVNNIFVPDSTQANVRYNYE